MGNSRLYLAVIAFVLTPLATIAQDFDPEAVSQVSKAIAEWKLMNDSEVEQEIYVTSALSPKVESGTRQGINELIGVSAFDSGYVQEVRSRFRELELRMKYEASNRYISRLSTTVGNISPAPFPTPTMVSAPASFAKKIQYIGKSIQVLSPLPYLDSNPEFNVSRSVLGIPVSGTRKGSGSFQIPGGQFDFHQIFITSGPDLLTSRSEWFTTDRGTFYRRVETRIPITSGRERFALTQFPAAVFDPHNHVVTETLKWDLSFRDTIGRGGSRYINDRMVTGGVPDTKAGVWRWYSGPRIAIPPLATGIGNRTPNPIDPFRIGIPIGKWDTSLQRYYNKIGAGSSFYVPSYARPRTSYSTIGQRR